ncbi:ribonuclease Z [Paenibacillus aurantius]|uniref:Ribonuclease Z n=1 Tax=Paenibacillus aurantius TaxID=2918900 RepID=A0AA96RCW9_9BACL|nr:ribonuclease Z [Paenibacillus aurantius]WNQ09147.1 ribonuclease Z [Paenibacillus aurantius]
MEYYFLGTGAGRPSKQRNVTSGILNLLAECGTCWLFDCGEGTQHQLMKSPYKPGKISKVFVTHLHGDHIFGLPGFLTSRSYQGGHSKVTVYGPPGIQLFLKTVFQVSESHLDYELEVVEIQEGIVMEDNRFKVEAAMVDHRIDSFGYRVTEKAGERPLYAGKLKERGIAPGPLFAQLKRGESVCLENGEQLHAKDFLGPAVTGRTLAVIGDTRSCARSVELAQDCDLLVHEATFAHRHQSLAADYGHSTAVEAAEIAKEAGVQKLVITHLSSRYQEEEAGLLAEAKEIFPETYLAHDFWGTAVPKRK